MLPPKIFEKLSELHLVKGESLGHPIQNHPVYIPETGKEPEFNCLNCHTSHASSQGLNLLKNGKNELCTECHEM